jgi:integrase
VLLDRQLARLSGVDLSTIRHRRLGEAHAERIDQALATLEPLAERLCFVRPPFSLSNVAATADAFDADLLVLDYIQRIPPPGEHGDKRGSVNATMDFLRQFADAGFAVIVLSAIGRIKDRKGRSSYKADEKTDRRRQRRAMNEAELTRLLEVARQRPLIEALTVRKGKRKGERYAKVRPEVRERLELLGRERALIYKTLVLTGLRKNELASLTVGRLHLGEPVPFAALDAADEKNRGGNEIPLRDDLATDLRDWLAFRLERLQGEAPECGEPIPARLLLDARFSTCRPGW